MLVGDAMTPPRRMIEVHQHVLSDEIIEIDSTRDGDTILVLIENYKGRWWMLCDRDEIVRALFPCP